MYLWYLRHFTKATSQYMSTQASHVRITVEASGLYPGVHSVDATVILARAVAASAYASYSFVGKMMFSQLWSPVAAHFAHIVVLFHIWWPGLKLHF